MATCAPLCTGSFLRRPTSSGSPLRSSSARNWTPWCRFTLPATRPAQEAPGPESDPHNPLLRDVGWNYLKGRLRSHPDVAERYYRDVLRERTEQLIV